MKEDVFLTMQNQMSSFSKGHKRIATYIVENYDKAAFMTANTLGKTVGISESTVVRFATELGYDGFPGFQKAMQAAVMNRLTSAERLASSGDGVEQDDFLRSFLHKEAEKIYQTAEILNRKEFSNAVEAITHAKRIYLIGSCMETALVKFTEYGLIFLCADVHTIISPESLTRLLFAENGDVVIAFCFSNCSDVSLKTVQYCKDAGATIVALSNSQLSPLAKLGDITLVAKTEDESFIDSLIAPMSVINALLTALISDRNNELREKMNSLGNVWHEYYVEEK